MTTVLFVILCSPYFIAHMCSFAICKLEISIVYEVTHTMLTSVTYKLLCSLGNSSLGTIIDRHRNT